MTATRDVDVASLSVRRPSHAGIVAKRPNISSKFFSPPDSTVILVVYGQIAVT